LNYRQNSTFEGGVFLWKAVEAYIRKMDRVKSCLCAERGIFGNFFDVMYKYISKKQQKIFIK